MLVRRSRKCSLRRCELKMQRPRFLHARQLAMQPRISRSSLLLAAVFTSTTDALHILALHGGGSGPSGMTWGTSGLRAALGSGHTFFFATAPEAGGRWIRDPPGGKSQPTTDPNWAQSSFTYLNDIVATQGPFDGLIGYSQGGAMTVLYLSQAQASFRFAVTFCGYVPTTHTGLVGRINAASPMSIPAAFYYGTSDWVISNAMTLAAAAHFSTTTMISDGGGHSIPQSGSALTATVSFINSFINTAASPPPPPTALSPPPSPPSPSPPPPNPPLPTCDCSCYSGATVGCPGPFQPFGCGQTSERACFTTGYAGECCSTSSSSPPPPSPSPPPETCASWCGYNLHINPWSVKCTWYLCSTCAACSVPPPTLSPPPPPPPMPPIFSSHLTVKYCSRQQHAVEVSCRAASAGSVYGRCCDGSIGGGTSLGCSIGASTLSAASQACASAGKRLCTVAEASSPVSSTGSCNTGCNYNNEEVWTSEPCQPSPPPSASPAPPPPPLPTPPDPSPPPPTPVSCPAVSSLPDGCSVGSSACSCQYVWDEEGCEAPTRVVQYCE